jgi:pyridoxal phosphate-dependent aminotransferase EpsN
MKGKKMPKRIYLSPPHMSGEELRLVEEVFVSNWIAPMGPQVDAFEAEFATMVGARYATAVVSGTAALHLALRLVGVGPGDEVLCSSLTFVASASPILYQGAIPVFIDSDRATWNMDPGLLREELEERARGKKLPKAVVLVRHRSDPGGLRPLRSPADRGRRRGPWGDVQGPPPGDVWQAGDLFLQWKQDHYHLWWRDADF